MSTYVTAIVLVLSLKLFGCGAADSAALTAADDLSASKVNSTSTDNRGEKGEKGEKGDKGDNGSGGKSGVDGAKGVDGTNGVAGATGATGPAGTAAHKLTLVDMNDSEIGDVYYLNAATSKYSAANGSFRFEIDQTDGTFGYAYLVFSGLNCTGTKRMVLVNGAFANTYVDGRDGSLIKAKGLNLGTFNFLSRVATATNCANVTSSTLVSFDVEVPTLPFSYPPGRVYIRN